MTSTFTCQRDGLSSLMPGLALAAFLWTGAAMPLLAQGLDSEGAIETIIDADVGTAEKTVGEEEERVVAAIEGTRESAAEIRKRFNIGAVEIVFMPELSEGQSALGDTIEENREAIGELQTAIESSAIFFHAINSHQVLLRDVIAVEFGEDDKITIFAAGKNPQN